MKKMHLEVVKETSANKEFLTDLAKVSIPFDFFIEVGRDKAWFAFCSTRSCSIPAKAATYEGCKSWVINGIKRAFKIDNDNWRSRYHEEPTDLDKQNEVIRIIENI